MLRDNANTVTPLEEDEDTDNDGGVCGGVSVLLLLFLLGLVQVPTPGVRPVTKITKSLGKFC